MLQVNYCQIPNKPHLIRWGNVGASGGLLVGFFHRISSQGVDNHGSDKSHLAPPMPV